MTKDFLQNYIALNSSPFQTFPEPVLILDPEGKIRYYNFQTENLFFSPERKSLLGSSFPELFAESKRNVETHLKEVSYGSSSKLEISLFLGDGKERDIRLTLSPVSNAEAIFCGTLVFIRDISTVKSLRRRSRWLKKFPTNNPDLIFQTSMDGRIKYYNPAVKRFIEGQKLDFKSGLNVFRKIFTDRFSGHAEEEFAEKSEFEAEIKQHILHFSYSTIFEDDEIFISGKDVTHYVALEMENMAYSSHLEDIVQEEVKQVEETQMAAIIGIAKLAETRDVSTGKHLERVREYSRIIAESLRTNEKYSLVLTSKVIEMIMLTSVLHDIGKVGIPDEILLKPGKFTKEEFTIMTEHSIIGGEAIDEMVKLLQKKGSEGQNILSFGRDIAFYHHEKYDGTGYPYGKKGNEIPLSARIVALADVFDAVMSRRVYKDAFTIDDALKIIEEGRGKHFDPDVVDAFCKRIDDIKKLALELSDS